MATTSESCVRLFSTRGNSDTRKSPPLGDSPELISRPLPQPMFPAASPFPFIQTGAYSAPRNERALPASSSAPSPVPTSRQLLGEVPPKVVFPPRESCYKCALVPPFSPTLNNLQSGYHVPQRAGRRHQVPRRDPDSHYLAPGRLKLVLGPRKLPLRRLMEISSASPRHVNEAPNTQAGQSRSVTSPPYLCQLF